MRRWIPVIIAFVVIVGMVGAVASGTSAAPDSGQIQTAPPSQATGTPVAALVDATGAAILLPRRSGPGLQIVGVRRGSGVAWRLVVADGVTLLGCVSCPTVAVSDASGRLGMISGGRLSWVDQLNEPLSTAIGVPGFAADQSSRAVATTAGPSALRLRLLGAPGQTLAATTTAPGVVLPLTRFQQANAQLAIAPSGTAVAIASVDTLHPGEWRVVEQTGARTVLDTVEPANLASVDDSSDIAACVSNDGRHTAFVVPDGRAFDVLTARTGGRLHRRRLPIGGGVLGCDVSDTSIAIASAPGAASGSNAAALTRVSDRGAVTTRRLPIPAESAQFCPGTGVLVTDGAKGTVIARPGHRLDIIRDAQLAGCTADGTAWFAHGLAISWIARFR